MNDHRSHFLCGHFPTEEAPKQLLALVLEQLRPYAATGQTH